MTTIAQRTTARHLLDDVVTRIGSGSPSLTTLEDLARWLGQAAVQLGGLDQATRRSRISGAGVVLAEAPGGHVMVVRYFPPAEPTPIHGHSGWGALVLLSGRGRYETWQPLDDRYARLTRVCELTGGETYAWADPPLDVHRQEGLGRGATELTIFKRHPYHTWAPQYAPEPPGATLPGVAAPLGSDGSR
ncbi:MAG: hypothetical protein ACRDTM_10990 [Micromonosporaceae bacterium]